MTTQRQQLQSAGRAYKQISYPGDLADVLQLRPKHSRHQFLRMLGTRGALAAAAALVFLAWGEVMSDHRGLTGSTSWAQEIRVRSGKWTRVPPGSLRLPSQMNTIPPLDMLAPPNASGLLSEVRSPLMSSTEFILSAGKDWIHRADALVHRG